MENLNGAISLQPSADLWEYLLVAHPSEEVNAKILNEKRNFETEYSQEPDKKFKPHITIAHFLAKEPMEETFIRCIQNICNLQKSFTVTLNNYSGFGSSGFYLRIQNEEPFKRLANALKILDGFMQSNDCPPVKLVSKAHISFAAGLCQYSFDKAVKEYSEKRFHESFRVEKLVLLKRDVYRECRLTNTFILPHH